ncbi:MAG: phosphoesterase [Armatimonadota bacterium]|nr:phosphoesterase [Armatimonadota bacterium]
MGVDEDILIVPRADLFWRGEFRGVTTDGLDEYLARIRRHGDFRRRGDVEEDPSLKQIIPYLVVRAGDRCMLFQRTQAGREGRLRGLFSIGVGGHIARDDVRGAEDVVSAALRRELEEELDVQGPWTARLVGALNDDGNAVGQVHFGLVHIVEVSSGEVAIRETDRLTGRLAAMAEVEAAYSQMETWSQLVLDAGVHRA